MVYLGLQPSAGEYADAVSEKMNTEGRDRSSWAAWSKTTHEVIVGNGVSHKPDVARLSKEIKAELRRRSAVVTQAEARRRELADAEAKRSAA